MRRTPCLSSSLAAALVLLFTSGARAQEAPAIAPPPPMDPAAPGAPSGDPSAPAAPEQATKDKLDEAERDDSGRNFELFWIDAHLGGSYIDMQQFSADKLAIEKASSSGPMVSFGAGLRLVVLVFGLRARYNALSAFNMWQLNGEIGFKIPISKVDVLIGGHGGYSFVGSIGDGTAATNGNTPTNNDAVKIRGLNAGLDFALDYYVAPLVSIGAGVFADFLFLKRPPVDPPAGLTPAQTALIQSDPLYQATGTSAGMQLGGGLRLGLHFGL
jgi:hypothetical protein